MTPRATRVKYSCMSSTHTRSFAERLNRAGCTGPDIGAIVRQHLFEPARKALSSLDLRDAQEYINTASVERKSALNPTTGVRPSQAIGCESIHRLHWVDHSRAPQIGQQLNGSMQSRDFDGTQPPAGGLCQSILQQDLCPHWNRRLPVRALVK
jgi:hypothetical protein